MEDLGVLCIANAGGHPQTLRGNRFSFSTAVCHQGHSASGCWAVLDEGRVYLNCWKCDFPESDQQIRHNMGLPAFEPGGNGYKVGVSQKVVKRYDYINQTTGETSNPSYRLLPFGVWAEQLL